MSYPAEFEPAHLVVPKQPEAGGLVMLVVADQAVVRSDLQQILPSCTLHLGTSVSSNTPADEEAHALG